MISSTKEDKFDVIVKRVLTKYPNILTRFYRLQEMQAYRLDMEYVDGGNGVKITDRYLLNEDGLARVSDPEMMVMGWIENALAEFTRNLGEEVTGKYPFTRLWADRHLENNVVPFFGNPNKEVPGWVHNKYRGQREYPDDRLYIHKTRRLKTEFEDSSVPMRRPTARYLVQTKEADLHGADADTIMKEVKRMAEPKKVRVVRGKAVDPTKIKKPLCRVHEVQMSFDAVRQLWKCGEDNCNIVARPKDDGDDRTVRIGKGNVQCRLISQDGVQTVILISDDNVALDVTRFIDLQTLLDDFDAVTIADAAADNGRETFSINDAKKLPLKMSLTIMGATDLVVSKEK